jgi:sec-independent protein translocase protein TatA
MLLHSPLKRKRQSMFHLGQTELIVILVVVVLLFGVGRIGKIAGELGSSIRSFKEGLNGNQEEKQ